MDTQFLSNKEVTYKEIVMIKNIIDLLNKNKKLALSKLKKWKIEEYIEDKRQRELRSEQMLEALKSAFVNKTKSI